MSDTVICVGSGIDVKRLSGVSDIPFGTSHWTFPGAIPSKAADFEVKNIRYDLPGTFQITHYFTVAGCTDSAFRLIHVAPIPTVNLGSDTTLCQGDTLRLVAGTDPLLHYSWNTGDSSRILVAGESKNYTVEVSNQAGCSGAGSIHVGFLTPGSVDLGPDTIFCEGTRIRIQPISALPGGHYKWNTGTTDTWLDVLSAGVYSLTVQTAACIQHDTIELKTTDCPDCRIYVPNIFYPEGDYPNDKFGVFPDCVLETLRFRVFDRWGNLVFESETPGASWDGKYHGKILPAGVYVYAIETQTAPQNGVLKPRTLFGTITLMR
jgi:gliding motility-associated-like protein